MTGPKRATSDDDHPRQAAPRPSVSAGEPGPQVSDTAPHDPSGAPRLHRPIVSFVNRGSGLNGTQRRAWDAHADAWLVERDHLDEAFDPSALFGRSAPLVIEIGSGMGRATAAMAAARPEINLLAIEVYKPGVAQTFSYLARAGVSNVRVLRTDAVDILRNVVIPGSLAELWLFFPDPWPKRKHHKRRLVTPDFAQLVASRLEPGGSWYLATDWEPYARQMDDVVSGCADLVNPHATAVGPAGAEWAPRAAFRPETRFEQRGRAADRRIFDLHVLRPATPPTRH